MFGSKKFDTISIGDTTLDVFLELQDGTRTECEHGDEDCWLCVRFGDKLAVDKVTHVPGVGNAANVAVGTSRLGLKSALYTVIGKDMTGQNCLHQLKEEKVATDYIQYDHERPTNYSTVLNFNGERTILVHHEHREYDLPKLAPAKWVYLTSIGAGHEKLHQQVLEYIEKSGAKLGFNPGTHQLEEGFERLRPVIEKCEVFIVNKEEAERLLGQGKEIQDMLREFYEAGTKIAVITDGPKGSYCFDGTNFYFQNIYECPIVERTGCGDSYSTGFISALSLGKDISEAMRWGTVNAAGVLQEIGAQKGLLRRSEIEERLATHPDFRTELLSSKEKPPDS